MMVGLMLGAASRRHLIVVDGMPACAALMVASRIAPAVTDYCIHCRSHGHPGLDQTLALFNTQRPARARHRQHRRHRRGAGLAAGAQRGGAADRGRRRRGSGPDASRRPRQPPLSDRRPRYWVSASRAGCRVLRQAAPRRSRRRPVTAGAIAAGGGTGGATRQRRRGERQRQKALPAAGSDTGGRRAPAAESRAARSARRPGVPIDAVRRLTDCSTRSASTCAPTGEGPRRLAVDRDEGETAMPGAVAAARGAAPSCPAGESATLPAAAASSRRGLGRSARRGAASGRCGPRSGPAGDRVHRHGGRVHGQAQPPEHGGRRNQGPDHECRQARKHAAIIIHRPLPEPAVCRHKFAMTAVVETRTCAAPAASR